MLWDVGQLIHLRRPAASVRVFNPGFLRTGPCSGAYAGACFGGYPGAHAE